MYHSDGFKILNLDLRGLGRDRKSVVGARVLWGRERNMESSEAGLLAKCAHMECYTEVRLFAACFICTWPANSPFLFASVIFFYCITDKYFNM